MPAVVKRDFPGRVAGMTALYSALLGGFGAIASGVAVPVSHLSWPQDPAGWRFALLLIGGVLLPFAIVAWIWRTAALSSRSRRAHAAAAARAPGIWTDRTAWLVAGYMGAPGDHLLHAGHLAREHLDLDRTLPRGGRPRCHALPAVLDRRIADPAAPAPRPRTPRHPGAHPLVGVIGVIGLMLAPEGIMFWAACLGSSSGASLSMSLTLMAQRARDHDTAAALSGMSQSVGYVVAAIGPVLFGWAHATTGNWMISLGLLLLALRARR